MTKPRLGKVRALFYVFQQVMTGREMRVHQNFDTPSFSSFLPKGRESGADSAARVIASAEPALSVFWGSVKRSKL